jgi:sulfoxide reductase heme-binding subunit YedZ
VELSRQAAKPLVIAFALGPAAWLAYAALGDGLGANPIETVTHVTGRWGLRFLLVTLAITPLRRIFGWKGLAPYRRIFGLLAFFYVCLHLLTFVSLDHFFAWDAILEDVVKRPFITLGFTAFLCMLPLAVTSTRGWMRRLGRRWRKLHRLVYAVGIAGVGHYLWLVKADLLPPFLHGGVLIVLLAIRVGYLPVKRPQDRRLESNFVRKRS